MSLETASYIHQLNPTNPSGADRLKEGDDHIRLIKASLKRTFPGITGPVDPSITPEFLLALKNQLVPRGAICLYAGTVAPVGWWMCDGTEATLSDGTGKFITPDLRGRAPVGADAVHTLGNLFGQYAKTVTSEAAGAITPAVTITEAGAHTHDITVAGTALTVAQMPSHTHTIISGSGGNSSYSADPDSGSGTSTTSPTGGGEAHTHTATASQVGAHTHAVAVTPIAGHAHSVTIDTAQPSIAVNFIIKV